MNATGIDTWRLWRIDGIGAALCVAMTLVTYFAAVQPSSRRHAVFATQRAELDARREDCRQLTETARALAEQSKASASELQGSPLRLEKPSQTNRRLAKITELANACGLKVNRITPASTIAGPRYGVVPIVLRGSGEYPTCVQFLRRLHKMFPDTAVAAIDLEASPNNAEIPTSFTFSLEWYTAPVNGPEG